MNQKTIKLLKVQLVVIIGAIILGILTTQLANAVINAITSTNALDQTQGVDTGGIAIGAGLAIGLAGLGAGIGMSGAGAAAIAAITEKPDTFGRAIIFVAFIEGIAIFGFVIAFQLAGKV